MPERILNKPGKLTAAEFETMKLHVDVGADILSSIDFPYPVVPIVRAHHENWDGTGYPNGLKGLDIPIGARILSVVDCYDALTSDRPYRAAMTDEQALGIIRARRGSMYDPVVVDTFERVCRDIAPGDGQAAVAEGDSADQQGGGAGADHAPVAAPMAGRRRPGSRCMALVNLARIVEGRTVSSRRGVGRLEPDSPRRSRRQLRRVPDQRCRRHDRGAVCRRSGLGGAAGVADGSR